MLRQIMKSDMKSWLLCHGTVDNVDCAKRQRPVHLQNLQIMTGHEAPPNGAPADCDSRRCFADYEQAN